MDFRNRITVGIVILFLTFIFMFQSPLNIWEKGGMPETDSGVFKTVALYMEKGYMPYKDIFDHKGPLLYLYNWLGLKLSYWNGIWFVEAVSLFITFCCLYKIARLVCNKRDSLLTLLFASSALFPFFGGGNYTEEYALPFISYSLLVFIDYFFHDKVDKMRLVLCGISFGAVCLLRPNLIPVWVVFCIAVLLKVIKDKAYDKLASFLIWFLLGTALLVVPVLIWLAANDAMQDFIYDYFVFNGMYSKNNYHLSYENRVDAFIFFLTIPSVLLSALFAIWLAVQRKDLLHRTYVIYIFVTLVFISVSGTTYDHYGMIIIPVLAYPFAVVLQLFCESNEERKIVLFNSNTIALILLLSFVVLPPWLNGLNRFVSVYESRNEPAKWSDSLETGNYVKEHTAGDDRIAVWENWDVIYALSGRLSASKYSYISPIAYVDESILPAYYEELNLHPPKMIIKRKGTRGSLSLTPEMWDIIDQYGYIHADDVDSADIYYLQ